MEEIGQAFPAYAHCCYDQLPPEGVRWQTTSLGEEE